ncbi:universal stress protein [Bacteroidota bacterium]
MKKILVPTDFSEQAGFALDFAIQIANSGIAEIILLTVVDYPGGMSSVWGGGVNVIGGAEPPMENVDEIFANNLIEKAKEDLDSIVNSKKVSGVTIIPKVQIGNPYISISEEIEDSHIDLVIIGSKGSAGLEEILIGSNTEKVVRHAKCPVLTIKRQRNIEEIEDIVFASNFEGDQSFVVNELKKIQKLLMGKLHLVKINTPNNFEASRPTTELMKGFAEKYNLDNYTLNIYNDFIEEDGIIYFAQDIDADMIALATHGRSGLMHLLSGSIAEDIVNHAKRPVWTCRLKHEK